MTPALDVLQDGIPLYGHPEGGFEQEQKDARAALANLKALVQAQRRLRDVRLLCSEKRRESLEAWWPYRHDEQDAEAEVAAALSRVLGEQQP